MSILYFDCFSGISGDMVIGALIHAGADPVLMERELKKLNLDEEYQLEWKKVIKNGISSIKFDVILTETSSNHHHSHEHGHNHVHNDHHEGNPSHSHPHSHEDVHTHIHEHEHGHEDVHTDSHGHEHGHEDTHTHSHEHEHGKDSNHTNSLDHHHHDGQRNYQEIIKMIKDAGFAESVSEVALKIFRKIGEAEGRIHGIPLEKVHFHEVGAVDSIIDIVGVAILLDQLTITEIKASPIPVGTGKIKIDHGIYPVPAPATLEILKGVPILQSEVKGELTTPTGAAIVSVLAEEYGSIPSMKVLAVGYGAGTKTFKEHPNVLRVILGE